MVMYQVSKCALGRTENQLIYKGLGSIVVKSLSVYICTTLTGICILTISSPV